MEIRTPSITEPLHVHTNHRPMHRGLLVDDRFERLAGGGGVDGGPVALELLGTWRGRSVGTIDAAHH